MSSIHVCPLSHVAEILSASEAEWVVSLLALSHRLPNFARIAPAQQLHLALSDIVQPTPDHVLAERAHVAAFLTFLDRWNRAAPLLIHCYAGVSRSTAAAFIALCYLDPGTTEVDHAQRLRDLSPTATPNRHLVALADAFLERDGRMVAAVAAIGRGCDCFEGIAFTLPLRPVATLGSGLDASILHPA